MRKVIDRVGQRFGRLVVIGRLENKGIHTRWRCRCDCGNEIDAYGTRLASDGQTSCGCAHSRIAKPTEWHGRTNTPAYLSWLGAKERCFSKNHISFARYGGRGITMCDEWANSFAAFFRDMGERPEGKSLDRIDNDGNYEPGNCRWATRSEQMRNRGPRRKKIAVSL